MKRRSGFVSNSSTSSFCLQGAYLGDFLEALEMIKKQDPEAYGKKIKEFFEDQLKESFEGYLKRESKAEQDEAKVDCEKEIKRFIELKDEEIAYDYESAELLQEFNWGDLSIEVGEETFLVGLPYSQLGENETGGEFKKRAQKAIDDVLGKGIKAKFLCDYIST